MIWVEEWWISLPHATFGITIRDGIVTGAAPIARWTLGKSRKQVLGYFHQRGAKIVRLVDR